MDKHLVLTAQDKLCSDLQVVFVRLIANVLKDLFTDLFKLRLPRYNPLLLRITLNGNNYCTYPITGLNLPIKATHYNFSC